MAVRYFTMAGQRSFAELSGDCNPLHVDPLAARRSLLGGVAVHGIHLVLWALDVLAADRVLRGFSRLRVQFERGVVVGDAVDLVWHPDKDRVLGKLTGVAGTSVRISLTPAEGDASAWPGAIENAALDCEEHEMPALEDKTGELALTLPPGWAVMFPHLAAGFPPAIVAALLATTRLVGMVSPGLYSILSGLDLSYDAATPPRESLRYHVIRADPRVHLVDMAVRTGGLHGTVSAFLRPKPYAQKTLAELRETVGAKEFAGQEAIVIGGSRGLGELAAKLLTMGGASVTISWLQGEADAQAIIAEATALGMHMRAQRFDVAAPPWNQPAPPAPYTHLYYFATPRIPAGRPGQFNPAIFATLLDTYVAGVARSADWLLPRGLPNACIWYPSTVFVEQPDPCFAEYAAAKACGEALCAQLSRQMAPLRVVADRLPRLPTDQTQALTAVATADGVETLLASLRRHAALTRQI
jgi:NAD(P)-dependent dehydrogenase (short-subunit alcohol dehydrogenase family)